MALRRVKVLSTTGWVDADVGHHGITTDKPGLMWMSNARILRSRLLFRMALGMYRRKQCAACSR